MARDEVLLEARFDEKLKTYWFLSGLWILAITCIGLPLIPIWLLGLGQYVSARRFEHHKARLTTKSLHISVGYLFKVEKHIPLDKIQDLSLREGPILRRLGLAALTVETAGQSQQGTPDANLAGLTDAVAFRDAVLDQRERVVSGAELQPATSVPTGQPAVAGDSALLTEIRDSLQRIEELLARD